ncbi:hypothetical protein LCGC14_2187920 [marine sediment metagenome]|uniref:Uncharacterized protein n=1 Tax=marine sediment metagenome TaxID=412755 RepID=A0A0F9FXT0_9ZZZZ
MPENFFSLSGMPRHSAVKPSERRPGVHIIALFKGNRTEFACLDAFFVFVFQHKQITDANGEKVKVGTPILYYKANRNSKSFRVDPAIVPHRRWMYNYEDNDTITRLGTVDDPTVQHKFASDYTAPAPDGRTGDEIFYDFITNPRQVTKAGGTTFYKPFNASEYILISAGWDGIFGTKDDLTNFNY